VPSRVSEFPQLRWPGIRREKALLTVYGAALEPWLRPSFDPASRLVQVDVRPTRPIGCVDRLVSELPHAGFENIASTVVAGKTTVDRDDRVDDASMRQSGILACLASILAGSAGGLHGFADRDIRARSTLGQ